MDCVHNAAEQWRFEMAMAAQIILPTLFALRDDADIVLKNNDAPIVHIEECSLHLSCNI